MRICTANLYYNEARATEPPAAFLERMPVLSHIPASLAAAGHEVDVVQLYPRNERFDLRGVTYHFLRPSLAEKGWARLAANVNGRTWTRLVPAFGALRHLLALQPDVIHFHGLTLNTTLYLLQMMRGVDRPAIVSQYHGGQLAGCRLGARMQSRGLSQVQRAIFSNPAAAQQFVEQGLLDKGQTAVVTDRSTTLTMASRPAARRVSGMHGSPVFLWLANLEPDRDPMTAIQGFEYVSRAWPKSQLYFYYHDDTLLPQLRAYAISQPELAQRVHFRGQPANESLESVFNSADFLLQTDRRADNGHVVLEAMACGVIPIVSDIAPFRLMVDNGRCGYLFPQGDAEALATQLLTFSPGKIAGKAAMVHDWFEAAYSYDALANVLLDIYSRAIDERLTQLERLNRPLTEATGQ